MTPRENRDDIIRRMVQQKRETERRELSSEEVQDIYDYVIKEVMPRTYEDQE